MTISKLNDTVIKHSSKLLAANIALAIMTLFMSASDNKFAGFCVGFSLAWSLHLWLKLLVSTEEKNK